MIRILVTTAGNDVMREIARRFAQGFVESGVACVVSEDEVPPVAVGAERWLMVAPHEYVPLFLARRLPTHDVDAICASSFILNVEQPGSQWFDAAFEVAKRARCLRHQLRRRRGVATPWHCGVSRADRSRADGG